jgi:ABC-type transport system involved in multi-copper enzyme maturation permease subunit
VSPFLEISHVVQRELRKNFRSAKGIILALLSLLGGSSVALLMVKYQEIKRQELGDITPEQIHMYREKLLSKAYGDDVMAKSLADSPEVLLFLLLLTVWLTPILVALMGFDSVSPDIQHRTVRYWSLRSRRWSYFVGKWAGLWATVSIVTFAMDLVIWVVCIARGEATVAQTFAWGLRFWLVSLPMSAVWCGIATLMSSLFRSPILALLLTFAAFFVIWVVYFASVLAGAEYVAYIYPNHYDRLLLHPQVHKLGAGLGACLGMAALYVSAGSFLFSKRDV